MSFVLAGSIEDGSVPDELGILSDEKDTKAHSVAEQQAGAKAHSIMERRGSGLRGFAASRA